MLAKEEFTSDQIAKSFLKAPLFNRKYSKGFGTIYTAVYRPKESLLQLMWPGITLHQTFADFSEGITTISYSERIDFSSSDAIPVNQLQEDYNGAVEAYWLESGRSWVSSEKPTKEPLNSISLRIKELLAQMQIVSPKGSSYPEQASKELWKRVGLKK